MANLSVSEVSTGLYGKILITFQYMKAKQHLYKDSEDKAHKMSNGDIVCVTDANTKPSCNAEISGIVYKTTQNSVTVSFEDMIEVDELQEPIALWLLPNDVTHTRWKQAVNSLTKNSNDEVLEYIRAILWGLSDPSESYNEFPDDLHNQVSKNWYNENLNEVQQEAVIHAMQSKELAVIHGPPGTGKTTTLVEFIKKSWLDLGAKVLCWAPSNIAVDNIAEKLIQNNGALNIVRIGHPARLLASVQKRCLDALVQKADATEVVHDSKKELQKVVKQLAKKQPKEVLYELRNQRKELRKDVKEFEKKAVKEIFSSAQVILSTTTMAGESKLFKYVDSLPGKAFDIVVIDEWAQATEPSCWIPLRYAKKVVFAGDHKQLEPTIKSMDASQQGLSNTLFEQIINRYEFNKA